MGSMIHDFAAYLKHKWWPPYHFCSRKDFAERSKILLDTDQKSNFVKLSK